MRLKTIVLLAVGLTVLALTPAVSLAGAGCCKKKADATAEGHTPCGSGCGGVATLAKNAEGGCAESTAKLIALAADSGNTETAALAAQAKAGDVAATKALIAKYTAGDPDLQELAANAQAGCPKSTAKLVELAKSSGCPRSWDLAERTAAGDAEAKAQLIAMFAAPATDQATK